MAMKPPSLDGWHTAALAAGTPREVLKLGINAFYASPKWKVIRFDVLAACPRCCLCGAGDELHVDHIVPLKVDWERRLDKSNLQVLCRDCNHGKASRDATDFRTLKQRVALDEPWDTDEWGRDECDACYYGRDIHSGLYACRLRPGVEVYRGWTCRSHLFDVRRQIDAYPLIDGYGALNINYAQIFDQHTQAYDRRPRCWFSKCDSRAADHDDRHEQRAAVARDDADSPFYGSPF